ncbi:phosphatase PAP2 family protein [Microbacterium sp. PAMC21962]|uniref:Phosphoesterase n=1 Tax=Microbacterium hominis TaxID=162426 RepID=A0A2K9D7P3_9MICO|nr:phosphoesterase [Microbacterium hominis]QOC25333.1 phosphatase PAP2 family protein [Microbacterium hominis]QYF98368.1 phosphatase PAP2 family protein [Microbacterium sp. PAMC21962]
MARRRPPSARTRASRDDGGDTRRWRSVRRQVDALDVATFTAIAGTRSPILDGAMPPLTRAADRSVLWMGVAALLAATGRPRARRAAVRGLAAIGLTSLLANQVSKRLHRRPRPAITQVPVQRLAHRIPASTSFPSGHSASAMAFAAAASAESPILTVPLRMLAGLVGFSRVATGAHYPSDVAAGFALGEAVAWLTTRIVPVERVDPLQDALAVHAGTPRPDGAGIALVINPRSGSGRAARILPVVRRTLPALRIVELGADDDYAEVIRRTAQECEVLAVAGGDGTVQQAAAAAHENGIPLAVLPAGTFNHFAKDLGMYPLSAAIDAVRAGTVAKVDLGEVNGRIFVNTASVGAYTDFVAIRERYEHRIGKPLAALVAAVRTLGRARAVRVRVRDLDGRAVDARFSLLFLGNGRYEPRGFAPVHRATLDDARLDLRVLGVSRRGSRARVVLDLFTGRISRNRRYQEFSDAEFDLELLDGPYRIARDGELGEEVDHLSARVLPRALTVIAPASASR